MTIEGSVGHLQERQHRDLASYYTANLAGKKEERCRVSAFQWTDFEILLKTNLEKMGIFETDADISLSLPGNTVEDVDMCMQSVLSHAESYLRSSIPDVRLLSSKAVDSRDQIRMIGHCDSCAITAHNGVMMIGLHCVESSYLSPSLEGLVPLAARMLCLNNLKYAYVTSAHTTIFIKRASLLETDIQVAVSRPVSLREKYFHLTNALCALAWQCKYGYGNRLEAKRLGHSCSDYSLPTQFQMYGHKLQEIPVSEPQIHDLRCPENIASGKSKWWKIKEASTRDCHLAFGAGSADTTLHDGLFIDGNASIGRRETRVVVKCVTIRPDRADYNAELDRLHNEASMYEYLAGNMTSRHLTKRYFYGNLLDSFRVLVLAPVGQSMQREDIDDHTVCMVERALAELHSLRILYRNIRLSSFYLQRQGAQVTVILTDFSYAERYNVLYKAASSKETALVHELFEVEGSMP